MTRVSVSADTDYMKGCLLEVETYISRIQDMQDAMPGIVEGFLADTFHLALGDQRYAAEVLALHLPTLTAAWDGSFSTWADDMERQIMEEAVSTVFGYFERHPGDLIEGRMLSSSDVHDALWERWSEL